jgi:hypothetical protein
MKSLTKSVRILLFALLLSGLSQVVRSQTLPATSPETVLATYRVKPDQLDAFLKMMPEYWAALLQRGLVVAQPYVLLRGEENGKPIFVQVFSWKDHEVSDHVPPAIQAYWDKMNAMVEARDGHPGIEFPEMTIVASGSR